MEQIRAGQQYKGTKFFGRVVSNQDPLQIKRVQARIPGLHDGLTDTQLPWCAPNTKDGIGESGGASSCFVPVLGALVTIEFQDGDMHHPLYVATPTMPGQLDPLFQTNYPNRWGISDPQGNQFYVDMAAGDTMLKLQSGYTIHIDKAGNVAMSTPGNVSNTAASWKFTGPVEFINAVKMDSTLEVEGLATFNGQVQVT